MTPLCTRHLVQLDRTAHIWPHLTDEELKDRAKAVAKQCRDCQGNPPATQHLGRDLE